MLLGRLATSNSKLFKRNSLPLARQSNTQRLLLRTLVQTLPPLNKPVPRSKHSSLLFRHRHRLQPQVQLLRPGLISRSHLATDGQSARPWSEINWATPKFK